MPDPKVQIEVSSSGTQQTAQDLGQITSATKAAVTEAERYEAALMRMAIAQEEQRRAAAGPAGSIRDADIADFVARKKAAAELATGITVVAAATGEAAAGVATLTAEKVKWSHSIALLTRQIPGLGLVTNALKSSFGYAGAAVMAAGIVVRQAIKDYQDFIAVYKRLAEEAAGSGFPKSIDANRDALRASAVAAAAYELSLKKLAAARQELQRRQEREDAAAKDRAKAAEALDLAAKETQLAAAKVRFKGDEVALAGALLEIEKQSAALAQKRAADEAQMEVQRLERQRRAAAQEAQAARRALDTLGPQAARATEAASEGKSDIAHIRDTDATAREALKKNEAAVDAILKVFGSGRELAPERREAIMRNASAGSLAGVMGAALPAGVMSTGDANQLILLAAAIAGNKQTIAATPGLLRTAERSQFTKEVAAEAAKAELSAGQARATKATERERDLGIALGDKQDEISVGRTAPIRQRRAETTFLAAEGADAILAGQAATEEQKAAIRAMAYSRGLIGKDLHAVIEEIASLNDMMASFRTELNRQSEVTRSLKFARGAGQ